MSKSNDDLGVTPEVAMQILSKWLPGQSTPASRARLTDEIKNKMLDDVIQFNGLEDFVAGLAAAIYALATAVGDMNREASA